MICNKCINKKLTRKRALQLYHNNNNTIILDNKEDRYLCAWIKFNRLSFFSSIVACCVTLSKRNLLFFSLFNQPVSDDNEQVSMNTDEIYQYIIHPPVYPQRCFVIYPFAI